MGLIKKIDKRDYFYLLIIVTIGILVTYNAYDNYYMIDDFIFIKDATISQNHISHVFSLHHKFIRPINNLTFLLHYSLFDVKPMGYYICNIIFHLTNSILVYWLARLFISQRKIAGLIGIFFVVNSVHAETIFWIAAMTGLQAAFVYLLSVIFFVIYSRNRQKIYYWISFLSFIIGLLTKESVISLPLILIFYCLFYYQELSLQKKDFYKILSPYILCSLIYIIIQSYIQFSFGHIYSGQYTIGLHAVAQLLLGFCLPIISPKISYIFNPIHAHALEDRELGLFLSQFGLTEKDLMTLVFVASIILIPLIVVALYRIFKSHNRLLKLSIAWTFGSLLPFSLYMRAYPAFRFLYIPSIGSSILFGLLLLIAFEYLNKFRPYATRYLVYLVAIIWILVNGRVLMIEEQNYERYGKNVNNMIQQLKQTYQSFPAGSILFFINIPVEDLDIKSIVHIFYQEKDIIAHRIDRIDGIPPPIKPNTFIFKYENGKLNEINTNFASLRSMGSLK